MLVFSETSTAAAYAGVQHIQHWRPRADAMDRCNAQKSHTHGEVMKCVSAHRHRHYQVHRREYAWHAERALHR